MPSFLKSTVRADRAAGTGMARRMTYLAVVA